MAKHPVPKKKTSKARTSRRYKSFQNRARLQLSHSILLSNCPQCGAVVRMHHACEACGFYRGQERLGKSQAAQAPQAAVTKIKAE